MQSFVIFYRTFLIYKLSATTKIRNKTGIYNEILMILSIRVAFTIVFLC